MNITGFNPMILSLKSADVISLFEDLGFEKHHAPSVETAQGEVTSISMKDAKGNRIDIAGVKTLPQDMTIIRMNVDNFEEAYDMLIAKGFRNSRGDEVIETETNKSALMISPYGFAFDLCQHIKD